MKKLIALLVLVLGFVLSTATPAFAGNGTVFRTEQACLQGIEAATIYTPSAMANRTAASTPSNGYRHAGVTGRVCVLEHTSMASSANGETRGWWWVVIDGGNLMVSSDGRSWRDSRCENAIRRIAQRPQEVATVVAECTNCHQQQTTPAPMEEITEEAPMEEVFEPAPAPRPTRRVVQQRQRVAAAPINLQQVVIGGGNIYVGGDSFSYNAGEITVNSVIAPAPTTPTIITNPPVVTTNPPIVGGGLPSGVTLGTNPQTGGDLLSGTTLVGLLSGTSLGSGVTLDSLASGVTLGTNSQSGYSDLSSGTSLGSGVTLGGGYTQNQGGDLNSGTSLGGGVTLNSYTNQTFSNNDLSSGVTLSSGTNLGGGTSVTTVQTVVIGTNPSS